MPDEARVLERVVAWGEAHPGVRALVLTSSRARQDETVDELSDYDVIVVAADAAGFVQSGDWLSAYPGALARWGDEDELFGHRTTFRGVVFEDGVKIDFTIWPEPLLARVSAEERLPEGLDVGYRVLLDKTGQTADWTAPTFRAHLPARPTEAEYLAVVEEFWWSSTYVAKSLWRDELLFAKFVLDVDLKLGALRRVLEWRIELERDWAHWPGKFGRDFARTLPPELWSELQATYVGPDLVENWDALFRTTTLFREVATEVGDALGYTYPQDVDDGITAHLEAVRNLG